MGRHLLIGAATAAALVAAQPASAQSGFYLGGHVGLNFASDSELLDDALVTSTERAALDFNDGRAYGGAIGYSTGSVRGELEITYRRDEAERITWFSPTGSLPASGTLEALAFLGNVYIDLDFGAPVVPYAGAGAGFAVLAFNDVTDSNGLVFDGDALTLVGQVILGAGIELTSNLTATLDYRYFTSAPMRFTFDPDYPDGAIAGRRFDIEYDSHAAMLGMRIGF